MTVRGMSRFLSVGGRNSQKITSTKKIASHKNHPPPPCPRCEEGCIVEGHDSKEMVTISPAPDGEGHEEGYDKYQIAGERIGVDECRIGPTRNSFPCMGKVLRDGV